MDLKTFQACSKDIIGLKYEEYDCWGLVKLFYSKIFGVELLQWFDYENRTHEVDTKTWAIISEEMIKSKTSNFEQVNKPKFGDILVLRIFGHAAHLGIYLSGQEILHTNKANGAFIDRMKRWEKMIEGIYRYVKV